MRIAIISNLVALAARGTTALVLKVNTTSGPVYGMINGTTPNVRQFLGVPFAEPPVDALRWLPAVPKKSVDYIDAMAFGPSCPQYESAIPSVYNVDSRNFLITGPTSEDCLSLNIWAPKIGYEEHKKLPVIIWIYGGGSLTGGGRIGYQIPAHWIERSQKHIVVGVNYRLNIFGFPRAAGLKSDQQNLGFLDIRLGVEWVRDNIANFGGDPSRISMWGQSAGAGATDAYNFAYQQDHIVAGIILDSGNVLGRPSTLTATDYANFTFVASHFGCGNSSSAQAELECMRKVEQTDIEAFLKAYQDGGFNPSISFVPAVDGVTKFEDYPARYAAGNFSRVPAIAGSNADEGTSLSSWVANGTAVNQTAADIITMQELCRVTETSRARHAAEATTFHYYYHGNWSNISPRSWGGAYHSSELPLIMGTHDIVHGPSTDFEIAVSHRMQDLYLAFAEDPYAGPIALGWPASAPNSSVIEFAPDDGIASRRVLVSEFEGRCDGAAPVVGAVPI
ncbi:para-nitrobenzyl esterase [Pseudomassariella vexata]|uniref:Para-nitrobenzyl esterase n=1 Tax=Pseudomassariella vexata TaxID=1141098 RepID=A0A1Y2DJ90_9PEZI|nr:para-nitrobenzyl esterase [Pseudomassariella vexata]ORY59280.1 para-nitrobenzyl esterase [Pseudomassariella vexata]